MANTAVITYIRVSTSQQGRSGLGIEAQRQSLHQFAKAARRTQPRFNGARMPTLTRNEFSGCTRRFRGGLAGTLSAASSTEADFQAWRDQEAWTAEKYRRFDRRERMPAGLESADDQTHLAMWRYCRSWLLGPSRGCQS
jgi:hypothetical protein